MAVRGKRADGGRGAATASASNESAVMASQRGSELGAQLGASVGAAAGTGLQTAAEVARAAGGLAAHGVETARSRSARLAAGGAGAALADVRTAAGQLTEVLEGVVEDARGRGVEVVGALSGRRPARRWPWAVAAAVAGATAGAGVALVVQRVLGQDAPGAQDPSELRAVVDPRPETTSGPIT